MSEPNKAMIAMLIGRWTEKDTPSEGSSQVFADWLERARSAVMLETEFNEKIPNTHGMWVEMHDMETGERKMIWDDSPNFIEYDDAWQFNWRENNYSCDCNRREMFTGIQTEEGGDDYDCNTGFRPNRYYVPRVFTADGRVIEIDATPADTADARLTAPPPEVDRKEDAVVKFELPENSKITVKQGGFFRVEQRGDHTRVVSSKCVLESTGPIKLGRNVTFEGLAWNVGEPK